MPFASDEPVSWHWKDAVPTEPEKLKLALVSPVSRGGAEVMVAAGDATSTSTCRQ